MFSIEYLDQAPVLLKVMHLKKRLFSEYEELYRLSSDQSAMQTIQEIMQDEERHYNKISRLYEKIIGSPPIELKWATSNISCFDDAISKALMDELDTIDLYRQIYRTVQKDEIRDLFFDIIMDEIKHAFKLNWLYAKNKFN